MSNAMAVAAATATLVSVLDEALADQGPGGVANVKATTLRPDMLLSANGEARGVNVFLFQVTPNAAWRTQDLPTRRSDGTLVTRARQALDLHYLLTFCGDETDLEPQRLLGVTVGTLASQPVLSRDVVRLAIERARAADPSTYLQFSDLADDIDVVRFTMSAMNLEELSKLWSTFFQATYRLSVPYVATVVLVENDDSPQTALPVRSRNLDAASFRAPTIGRVVADSGPGDPITTGTTIRVEGERLSSTVTRLRVTSATGIVEIDPGPDAVTERRITAVLPADVLAGVHGVQVLHPFLVGDPPTERAPVESNAAPMIVSPTVSGVVTTAPGTGLNEVVVTVPLTPGVSARQPVVLLLNERGAPDDRPPRAYSFVLPPRTDAALPDPAPPVVVTTRGVEPGDYLVRVQVDGAASTLGVGADGRYDSPVVTFS
jgi:hypothetical protein